MPDLTLIYNILRQHEELSAYKELCRMFAIHLTTFRLYQINGLPQICTTKPMNVPKLTKSDYEQVARKVKQQQSRIGFQVDE